MHKSLFKYLLFSLLIILFLATALIIYISSLQINDYKEYFEDSFRKNTGLSLHIEGDIKIDFENDFHFTSGKISVFDSRGLLFKIDSVNLTTAIHWPKDSLIIHGLYLENPTYHFRTQGIKNGEVTASKSSFLSFSLEKIIIDTIVIKNGHFLLTNASDSSVVDVSGIECNDGYLHLEIEKPILQGLLISADVTARNANAFAISNENLDCAFEMKDGYLKFNTTFFDRSNDTLFLTLNLNPEFVEYNFQGKIRQEKIKTLYSNLDAPSIDFISGTFDADYKFGFSIPDDSLDMKSITAKIELHSKSAVIKGVNLDKLIKSFKRTQNFSMKDLGSVLLLGPWGLAISKGGDYAELAMAASKDSTEIELLHCQFSVDSGRFLLEDVAFRTSKYRVALSGEIDVVNKSYVSFAYAIIDEEGCSEIREEFNGLFEEAKVSENSNIKVLLGPVTNLFNGSSSIVKNKDCDNQYKGVVAPPQKKSLFKKNSKTKETSAPQKPQKTTRKKKKKKKKKDLPG